MNRSGPSPLARGLPLLVALAALACRGPSVQVRRGVPEGLGASAVGVYPFGLRWDAPAWRAVELSQRLADVALAEAGDSALFFGPTEVRVYRPQADDAWAASDAVAVLASHGVRPADALVPRPRAERRIQAGERELLDSRGRPVGQSANEAATDLGTVEVLHPASQRGGLEVSGEAAADPFAEGTDDGADPAPELTRRRESLTREALRGLSGAPGREAGGGGPGARPRGPPRPAPGPGPDTQGLHSLGGAGDARVGKDCSTLAALTLSWGKRRSSGLPARSPHP